MLLVTNLAASFKDVTWSNKGFRAVFERATMRSLNHEDKHLSATLSGLLSPSGGFNVFLHLSWILHSGNSKSKLNYWLNILEYSMRRVKSEVCPSSLAALKQELRQLNRCEDLGLLQPACHRISPQFWTLGISGGLLLLKFPQAKQTKIFPAIIKGR